MGILDAQCVGRKRRKMKVERTKYQLRPFQDDVVVVGVWIREEGNKMRVVIGGSIRCMKLLECYLRGLGFTEKDVVSGGRRRRDFLVTHDRYNKWYNSVKQWLVETDHFRRLMS